MQTLLWACGVGEVAGAGSDERGPGVEHAAQMAIAYRLCGRTSDSIQTTDPGTDLFSLLCTQSSSVLF
jgi:hypothetical protein